LLARHPGIDVVAASASARVGVGLADFYPHLDAYKRLTFVTIEEALSTPVDIVFPSLPHGESMKIFGEFEKAKVVDIAGDFRLSDPALYPNWYGSEHASPSALSGWVYGLTELHRKEVSAAERVANPGCYSAAAILALAPLVASGALRTTGIHVDAKSGISGAGRAGGEDFDFTYSNENTRPYAVVGHKHIPEIEQELGALAGGEVRVSMVPHLVPMTRGIVATCVAELAGRWRTAELIALMRDRYRGEPFVRVLDEDTLPESKRLTGTNLAEVTVRVDERTSKAIAIAAIDNLGKGAAGQAIQNANLMLGFDETTALDISGLIP
jgi:N-acetyl-gamma-glutamyl-phosphate reductase